jgi:hypothetical protein
LGDILMEAMGISPMQVTYLAVEKVYGREARTDIMIEPLS